LRDGKTVEAVFHRLLLDENPDAAIITSPTGEIVFWNEVAESIFGFSSAKVVGSLLADIAVPSDWLAAIRLGVRRFPLRPVEPRMSIEEISACLENRSPVAHG